MSRNVLLALIVFAASPCEGAKLFVCRDAGGHVSFVDDGCPQARERREIALTAAPTKRKTASDADAKQIAAWEKASRSRLPTSLGGTARSGNGNGARHRAATADRHDACSSARSAQAKAERERSFQLGFDERRRLSDAVLSACGLR